MTKPNPPKTQIASKSIVIEIEKKTQITRTEIEEGRRDEREVTPRTEEKATGEEEIAREVIQGKGRKRLMRRIGRMSRKVIEERILIEEIRISMMTGGVVMMTRIVTEKPMIIETDEMKNLRKLVEKFHQNLKIFELF